MAITATLVVSFGVDEDKRHLVAELDSELNNDKANFFPGDPVYFRVWSDGEYRVRLSAGTVSKHTSNDTESLEEVITYGDVAEANVAKQIHTVDGDVVWWGNDPGQPAVGLPTKLYLSEKVIAAGKVNYTTQYDVWRWAPSAGLPDSYTIVIVVETI